MFEGLFSSWLPMTASYFGAPVALLSGTFLIPSLIATAGMVAFIVGLVLALRARERQLLWLAPPLLATLLTPIILSLARGMMGWLGMLFAIMIGVAMLLVWAGMIASDADRRLPIWLVALGYISYAVYCASIGIVIVWSGG